MANIKDKILESALKQFLKYGKLGAKTKAIADGAGVNKALIHYYYSSKDLLYVECVKFILKKMEGTFHTIEIRSIKDYKKYIKAVIESYSTFIDNHDKEVIFLIWEYLNDKDLICQIKEMIGSSHLDDFIQKTETAIKDGIIKDVDPLYIYLNIISLILSTHVLLPITVSFLSNKHNNEKDEIIKKRKEEITKLLWTDIKGDKGEEF